MTTSQPVLRPSARDRASIAVQVTRYCTAPVVTIPEAMTLTEAAQVLERERISCAPVVGARGRPLGALSRVDLVRAGKREAAGHGSSVLTLPSKRAGEIASHPLATVPWDTPVSAAARRMVKERIHRVFVERYGEIIGVFSTKDLLSAIVATTVDTAVRDAMSGPVYTIPLAATIAHAVERLERAHVSGLVVIDDAAWPVATFTQSDALRVRDVRCDTTLGEVVEYATAFVQASTPLCRAAEAARGMDARRLLVLEEAHVAGVMTGLDFARAVM